MGRPAGAEIAEGGLRGFDRGRVGIGRRGSVMGPAGRCRGSMQGAGRLRSLSVFLGQRGSAMGRPVREIDYRGRPVIDRSM